MKKENISDAVIRRLPRYYRQLTDLCARGVVRISSHSLGQEMNITASQIRQDFSCFGEFGQQGYGYNVEELRAEIGHILGVDNDHHLIMIGVGNLGRALLRNFPFSQTGFSVDAAFDVSTAVVGSSVNGVPVYAMEELESYIEKHSVDVVVLTIPQSVAQDTANRLIELGVHGFWNFTNVELSSSNPDVKFENIHFADPQLSHCQPLNVPPRRTTARLTKGYLPNYAQKDLDLIPALRIAAGGGIESCRRWRGGFDGITVLPGGRILRCCGQPCRAGTGRV